MPNVEHFDMYSGEGRTFTLHGRDAANAASNLTARTVAWYVGRSPFRPDNSAPIITKAGTVTDAASGVFTVPVTLDDTQYLNGDFEHMAVASDADGAREVISQGRFRIRPVLSP